MAARTKAETQGEKRDRAVVLGGGFSGLLAARALADVYHRVLVIETESEPTWPEERSKEAVGDHARLLLASGEAVLDELFPGLFGALERLGAQRFDYGAGVGWHQHGVWKGRCHSGIDVHAQSRQLLEHLLRRRLSRWDGIEIRYQTEALGLVLGESTFVDWGQAVRGLWIAGDRGKRELLEADLVVDASGRSSAVPRWLREAGFGRVPEERQFINLKLSSRLFRIPSNLGEGCRALWIGQDGPGQKRLGALLPVEGGRWLVTLGGYAGDHPPVDGGDFLDFARDLARPEIYRAIRGAEPLSEVWQQRFPYALRRAYGRMPQLPSGLVALGDAVASFDPVMGPGLALAAKGASLLAKHLARGSSPKGQRAYFRALEREIAASWTLATGEVFPFAQTLHGRSRWAALVHGYARVLGQVSASDPQTYSRFLRVLHLLHRPVRLLHPKLLLLAARSLLRRPERELPRPVTSIS